MHALVEVVSGRYQQHVRKLQWHVQTRAVKHNEMPTCARVTLTPAMAPVLALIIYLTSPASPVVVVPSVRFGWR